MPQTQTQTQLALNNDLLLLINTNRKQRGLTPLEVHPTLIKSATIHSEEMARTGILDHYSVDKRNWADRIAEAGYPGASLYNCGEDIAEGYADVRGVYEAWISDWGHLRPIINPQGQHMGLGTATDNQGRIWWTLDFCQTTPIPSPQPPVPTPTPSPHDHDHDHDSPHSIWDWFSRLLRG